MLRIGYDAKRIFNNFSGLGNYSRTLLRDLSKFHPEHEYYLYTPSVQSNVETAFFLDKGRLLTRSCPHPFKAYWRTTGLVKDLIKDGVQLYHGLSHEIPKGLAAKKIKSIVTIHDLIFKVHPEWYPIADRHIYDFKCKYACRKADHIIAVSEHTRQDIIRLYDIALEKISVVPPANALNFQQAPSANRIKEVKERFQLPEDFLLYVGSLSERKGVQDLIQALSLLPSEQDIPLIIVGQGKRYQKELKALSKRLQLDHRIHFHESVSNTELPAFYHLANAFVYPSRYEGFGLPLVEASLMGTAVISTDASALPATLGSGALLAQAGQAESLADCIQKVLNDASLASNLVSKAQAHCQEKYTPKDLSQQMNDLYRKVLDI